MTERKNDSSNAVTVGIVILIAVIGLFLIKSMRQEQQIPEPGGPDRPVLFVLSREHGSALTAADRAALTEMLRRESGMNIDLAVAGSSLDAIEAFDRDGTVGLLNLFEYLLARREYGVEAAMQVTRRDGAAGYSGVIAVLDNSRVQSVKDLSGKKFAYSDPFSTSGFVFPAKILAEAGIEVVPEFTGSHAAALEKIRSGAVEAGATYAAALEGIEGLRVIAATDTIPNEAIFFRRGTPPATKDKFAKALIAVAATPEGATILRTIADIEGFRPASNETYDGAIQVIRAAGLRISEVVPEGVKVESRRRGISIVP